MKMSLLAAAASLVAASPAQAAEPTSGEAELARLLEGRVAGEPVDCLPLQGLGSARVIPGTALVYRIGSKLYVNRPRVGVGDLHPNDILVVRPYNVRLCRLDMVERVDRNAGFWRGFVSLDRFVPYTKAK